MRSRARRHIRRPPDLTSLFDVLFIVVFVALIRAAAAEQALAARPPEPPRPAPPLPTPAPPAPPAVPVDVATLRAQALANVNRDLAERMPVVLRIATRAGRDGTLDARLAAIEVDGRRTTLDTPLLEYSPNPDEVLRYLGSRSTEQRLCKLAQVHLGAPDLARHFVIVAPVQAVADLPRALSEGLQADVARCSDLRGLASLVDPAALPKPKPSTPP